MTDDLFARVEAEARAAKAAERAARKSPTALAKRQCGRTQKRRGYAAEKGVEAELAPYGFKRVPLSGALGGALSGDVARYIGGRFVCEGRAVERLEIKRRAGQQRLLRRWLEQGGGVDAVVIDTGGRDDQLVVLSLPTLMRLLSEGGYGP